MPNSIENNMGIRCKNSVGSHIARFYQSAGLEIFVIQYNCKIIADKFAGYLAKDNVISF